jgi:hypothetical protein
MVTHPTQKKKKKIHDDHILYQEILRFGVYGGTVWEVPYPTIAPETDPEKAKLKQMLREILTEGD